MIKPLVGNATPEQIVALGWEMAMESRFARLGYEFDLAADHAKAILTERHYIGFGAFKEGELVGMITGVCGAFMPFTRAIVARQQLLFMSTPHRSPWVVAKLIGAFIAEAQSRGARDVAMENGTGYEPERVGRLFEICGLQRVGGLYAKEI